MAYRVFVSVVLFMFLCIQQSRSAHKDIAQSNLETENKLRNYPVPGPKNRMRRQEKTYNFRQPIYDNHKYYRQQQLSGAVADHWIELANDNKHIKLSNSGGGYDEINATFHFRFYGHTIKRVYLSTAGVLSMSAFSDEQPPTHYIAQFLGHFSPNLHLDSAIFFESQGDKFIVEWRDVYLREPNSLGPFTLETIVYPDGTIKFLYKTLPKLPANTTIDSNLIIGLVGSINIEIAGIKLSAYYQAEFIDPQELSEGDVIIFHPEDTCDTAADCDTCVSRDIGFDCKWCGITETCYDALDRYTQDFKESGCASQATSDCLSEWGDLYDLEDLYELSDNEQTLSDNEQTQTQTEKQTHNTDESSSSDTAVIVIVVVVLVVIGVLGGWSFYAYKNPDSPSGRWLIQHRPSQWKTLIFGRMAPPREEQEQPQY